MNAKKICALALSLGLFTSSAPKIDAVLKDTAKVAVVYASYRAANILIPKYTNYSLPWDMTKKAVGELITFVKGYIDMGVDAAIKLAEEKFDLEKNFGKENEDNNIDNENEDEKE